MGHQFLRWKQPRPLSFTCLIFYNILQSLLGAWDRRFVLGVREIQVGRVFQSKKSYVFSRRSQFLYDLSTLPPTPLWLKSKKHKLRNVSATISHDFFLNIESIFQIHARNNFNKTISRAGTHSLFSCVADECSSAFEFAKSSFSLLTVANFFSVFTRYVNTIIIAAPFSNINFINC